MHHSLAFIFVKRIALEVVISHVRGHFLFHLNLTTTILFFSLTSCDDLLTTTFHVPKEGRYRELEPRARLPCRFDCQIGRQRQIAACVRRHLGGRRADAGRRRGGLARVEIRFARHLAASQVGGDLIGRRRPLRGQRRPHPQASSTTGASMPSPLHAVIAASAAPRVRTWPWRCARSPPFRLCASGRPHARPSARRAYIMPTARALPLVAHRQRKPSQWAPQAAAGRRSAGSSVGLCHLRGPLLARVSVCLPRQAACLGKHRASLPRQALAWASAGQAGPG